MASTPYHYLFKFVLVGDSGVGKSCILLRFIKDKFLDKHELTLGASYDTSILEIHNKTIKLQIWDTAGQEAYLSVTRAYYRGAIAAFLVFDVANQSTFDNVKDWVK
jgi:Ras-related protein Rab-2A